MHHLQLSKWGITNRDEGTTLCIVSTPQMMELDSPKAQPSSERVGGWRHAWAQPCLCTGMKPKYGISRHQKWPWPPLRPFFLSSSSPGTYLHWRCTRAASRERCSWPTWRRADTERTLPHPGEHKRYTMERGSRDPQSSGGPPGGQHYPMTSIIPTQSNLKSTPPS